MLIIYSNSIPPTTSVENLRVKQQTAEGKICVDVGFWGGIVPGNENELKKLLEQGVIGFKCFLHPSGDEYFPYVEEKDVELAFKQLVGLDALIAVGFEFFYYKMNKKLTICKFQSIVQFHAEKRNDANQCADDMNNNQCDVYDYATYLNTRPSSLELNAIEMITRLAQKYDR